MDLGLAISKAYGMLPPDVAGGSKRGKQSQLIEPTVLTKAGGVQVAQQRVVLNALRGGMLPVRVAGYAAPMLLLEGKTMVVTGGNSGIGAAIVKAAAAQGANVVIDYVDHPEETDQLVAAINALGGKAVGVQADVTRAADLHKLVETAVNTYGRLDVLVNNAGIETRTSILDTTEEDYERVLAVNLKSSFFGIQFAARQFIAQGGGGIVINISSVHEDWPMPGNTAYCVSKGGERMLARTAGVELGPHGIRVVNVCPGAVATPINQSTIDDPVKLQQLKAAIPLGRLAQPDDIADVVVFLASGQNDYMTATSVFIDGGIMMGSVGL